MSWSEPIEGENSSDIPGFNGTLTLGANVENTTGLSLGITIGPVGKAEWVSSGVTVGLSYTQTSGSNQSFIYGTYGNTVYGQYVKYVNPYKPPLIGPKSLESAVLKNVDKDPVQIAANSKEGADITYNFGGELTWHQNGKYEYFEVGDKDGWSKMRDATKQFEIFSSDCIDTPFKKNSAASQVNTSLSESETTQQHSAVILTEHTVDSPGPVTKESSTTITATAGDSVVEITTGTVSLTNGPASVVNSPGGTQLTGDLINMVSGGAGGTDTAATPPVVPDDAALFAAAEAEAEAVENEMDEEEAAYWAQHEEHDD